MDLFTTVDPRVAQERWQDKLLRKCKEEPYVPIGASRARLGVSVVSAHARAAPQGPR